MEKNVQRTTPMKMDAKYNVSLECFYETQSKTNEFQEQIYLNIKEKINGIRDTWESSHAESQIPY